MAQFNEEDRQWLYDTMKDRGVDTGSYDDFKQSLDNDEDRQWYYNKSVELGLDVGTKDDFDNMMWERKQPTSEVVANEQKGGYKPTAAEMAGFNSTIRSANNTVAGSLQGFDKKVQNLEKRQGIVAPQEIRVGESNNLVKGDQHLNPETGKLEDTYITSSGNEYDNKTLADEEQRQIDQNIRDERYRQTLPGQLEDAYAERDRLKAELAKHQASWVDQDGRVHYNDRADDESVASLESALRQNQQRITALEAERDDDGGTQFWRGFYDTITNPDVYSFGVTGLADAAQMLKLKNKIDKAREQGVEPEFTNAERSLIQSVENSEYAQRVFGSNRGSMYNFGGGFAQSLPFIFEIAATGGMGGLSEVGFSAGKKAATKIATAAVEKAMIRNLGKGGKWIADMAVKGSGALGGITGGGLIMANTTGAAKTSADIIDRFVGNMTRDENGNIQFEDGASIGEAIAKGQLAQAFEYGSELVGDKYIEKYMPVIGEAAMRTIRKLGPEKAKPFLEALLTNKLTQGIGKLTNSRYFEKGEKMLNYAGVQGWFAEGMEEEANNILNAIFVGDTSWMKNDPNKPAVFSTKDQLELWEQTVLTSALLRAPQTVQTVGKAAGYYGYKHATDVADANAASVFGNDNWQMIKESIDNCTNESLPQLLESVIKGDMTQKQKEATVFYADNLLKMRGYNAALASDGFGEKKEEDGVDAVIDELLEKGYQQGHQAQLPDEQKAVVDEAKKAEDALKQFGDEFAVLVTAGNDHPGNTLRYLMEHRDSFTDEQIAAATDYYQKQVAADAMMDAALDDIDLKVKQNTANIMSNSHTDSGQVITAVNGDNTYYVLGGEVATAEDGTPQIVGTGGAVTVKNAQTGEISIMSPQQLTPVGAVNTDELIQNSEQSLREQLTKQADDNIGYGSPANETFQNGDMVTLRDRDGEIIEGQVMVPETVDGEYQVITSDNKSTPYTLDDLNLMIVAHNGQQVQRGSQPFNVPENVETGTNGNENVPETAENAQNGQNYAQNSSENIQGAVLDNAGGEAGSEQTSGNEPPASASSRIPVNEQGQPDYLKAEPQDSYDALVEELGEEDANAIIESEVSDAQKRLSRIQRKAPQGATIEEKKRNLAERRAQMEAEQATVDYWNSVLEIPKSRKAEAERLAAEEVQQKAIAERKAKMQTPEGREELLSGAKNNQERAAIAKEIYGDYFNDKTGEPDTVEELVSMLLPYGKLNWEGYQRGTTHVRGLQEELGSQHSRGLSKDKGTSGFNSYLAKKGEGESLDDIVHSMYEDDSNLINGEHRFTTEEIKDAVIDMLLSAEKPTDIRDYIINSRIDRAERTMRSELDRDAEAELDAWAEFYHLTPEEREDFEDWLQLPPTEPEQEVINNIIAEHAERQSNGTSPSVGEQPVSGGIPAGVGGGEGQVQGAVEAAGNGVNAETVEASSKTDSGEPAVSGDQVAGGTQGVETATAAEPIGKTSSPEEIAQEEAKVDTNPTEGQKEAGNYQKGHIKVAGLDISIENPKGSVRRGTDANGKEWESTMHNTYGYIRGTQGADKDHIDVYLSDDPMRSNKVFIVQQRKKVNGTWKFDELKVLLGFDDAAQASNAYLSNYEEGWDGMQALIETDIDSFKEWLKDGNQKGTYKEDGAWAKVYPGVSDMVADEGQMPEPEQQEVEVLRGKGNNRMPGMGRELSEVSGGRGQEALSQSDSGQNRREQGLLQGELQVDELDNPVAEPQNRPLSDVQGQNDVNATVGSGNGAAAAEDKVQNPDIQMERGENAGNPGRNQGQLQNDNLSGKDVENGGLGKSAQPELQNAEEQDKAGLDNGKNSQDANKTNQWGVDESTPLGKLLTQLKEKREGLYLFRTDDGYLAIGVDAPVVSKISDTGLNNEEYGQSTSFTKDDLNTILPKLIRAGHRVAIVDQDADPNRVKKALNSQNSLNRKEIVSESEGNSVPLPQRTRKSYTDGKGNYHRGLEEELADIEAAISGGGEAAEGAASQSSATSEGARGDVDSLRRQAALIRAEIARRDQLKQEFRKKYNISEKGDIILDDLSRLFHDLNSDKAVGELFDNIRDVLKKLGTDFRFTDRMDGVTGGVTKGTYNIDFFNWDLLVRDRDQQDKAGTFLHEMIHNISERLIQRYEDPSIGKLTKKQRELVEELQDIFAVVDAADLRHEDGTKMYGATEMREMLSELAKPWFREELDKIPYKGKQTVWQRIKQWFRDLIRNFVDVKEPTVLDRLDKVVDEILDTYGEEEIRDYRQDREHLGRMYDIAKKDLMDELEGTLGYVGPYEIVRGPEGERTLMGVHNISEDKLKKIIKAGGLANPSLAVIDTKKGMHNGFGEISLIPKSALIDSKTGRNAGTYLGDAYTPTYPTVETSLSEKGRAHITEIAKAAAGDDEQLMHHLRGNLKDYIEGNGSRLHYLFLLQTGRNPKPAMKRLNYSEDAYNELKDLIDGDILDKRELTQEENDRIMNAMLNERLAKYGDKLTPEKREAIEKNFRDNNVGKDGKLFFSNWYTFVEALSHDARQRKNPTIDWYGTDLEAQNRVNDERLYNEYEEWKKNLLNDEDINEELFAGYDRNGYRKTVPNTVENASRLMNKEADTNANDASGLGATRSKLIEKVSTLSQIRKNKERLKGSPKDDAAVELSDKLYSIIKDLADRQKISDNPFSNIDYAELRLQEALEKKSPIKHLRDEYGYDIADDSEFAKELAEFVSDIKDAPVSYFETKFKRPVGLNEFAVAVVPETTSPEVVNALKDAGLDVRTYDASNEKTANENRQKVAMDAVSGRDDILFREGVEAQNAEADSGAKKTAKQQRERKAFAERPWRRAHDVAKEWVEKLKLGDVVTVVDSIDEVPNAAYFKDSKRRAKGWYDPRTDKIVVVIGNNRSPEDVMKTILHEAVAHYGLRKLFGDNFNTFLKNVYNSASDDIRTEIDAMAESKYGGDIPKATEEYLARLAEDTDFERAMNQGWWQKIKKFFLDMLKELGLPDYDKMLSVLSDNELRYILWRSYENLAEPGRYRNVFQTAKDITKQVKLNVGNYERQRARLQKTGKTDTSWMAADSTSLYQEADELIADMQENAPKNMKESLSIKDRVAFLPAKQLQYAYKKVNDMMKDEDGLDIDEHSEKVKQDWIAEHGIEGVGKAMSDDLKALMDKYGEGLLALRWELQDRINELESEDTTLHRDADEEDNKRPDLHTGSSAVDEYNKSLEKPEDFSWSKALYKVPVNKTWRKYVGGRFREAWQDSMMTLKRAQNIIVKESGKPLQDYEDAYTEENLSHGRAKNEYEWFDRNLYNPLLNSFLALKKAMNGTDEDVHRYMFAKHGLERNVVMAFRDAVKRHVQALERDYNSRKKAYDEAESRIRQKEKHIENLEGLGFKDRAEEHRKELNRMKAALNRRKVPDKPETEADIHKAYQADAGRIQNEQDFKDGKIDYRTYRERDDQIRASYAPESYFILRQNDYSGLTGMYAEGEKPSTADAENAAYKMVERVEKDHKPLTDDLWQKVNGCTKWTLQKSYQSGMMSREMLDVISGMYDYYIPLRGWDGTNAQDVYDYVGGRSGVFSKAVIPAKGRTSVADNPIAYIGNMAMSNIVIGQKNMVKQRVLNLARNHPNELLKPDRVWYENRGDENNPDWVAVTPDIPADASQEEIVSIIDAFNKRMKQLQADGKATQTRGSLSISYPAPDPQLKEHEIRVQDNGQEYVIYVNGDPRVAQAVNGTRARKMREGNGGLITMMAEKSGRFKAAVYTSFSPAFVITNWTRDMTMAITSSLIDKGIGYNATAAKNTAALLNPFGKNSIYRMMWLYTHDRLDMRSPTQRMFKEFMANGGETGFIAQLDLEAFKNGINKELGRADQHKLDPRRAFRVYLNATEFLNRCIEDSTRFIVYKTSRQTGETIQKSASEAKDVTLNFNRKGTGELGNGFARGAYIFVNPAVQGIQTVFRLIKHHPYKFTALTTGWIMGGAMQPYLNQMLMELLGPGDDDDKDAYWKLPEHVRRQCMVFYVGNGEFVTIPLAQEFRAFWGIGETAMARLMGHGKGDYVDDGMEIMESFLDLLPLDVLGHGVREQEFATREWFQAMGLNFTPDIIKTEVESIANTDWTGKPLFKDNQNNKNLPAWGKAYKGTPDWLVKSTEVLNEATGGEGSWKPGKLDWNPAIINHELQGWFSGPFNFFGGIGNVSYKVLNGDPVNIYDVPVLNRILNAPAERSFDNKLGEDYWKMYREEFSPMNDSFAQMKREAKAGNGKALESLEKFFMSDDYKRYKEMKDQVDVADERRKNEAEGNGAFDFEYTNNRTEPTPEQEYKKRLNGKDEFEEWCVDQIGQKCAKYAKELENMRDNGASREEQDEYMDRFGLYIEARQAVEDYREYRNDMREEFGHVDEKQEKKTMTSIRKKRDELLRIYRFDDIFKKSDAEK